MTALKKYARIEATGLWRADADAQRREVIVSIGEASLTLKGIDDQALAHWSLAAVSRANPGEYPAVFHPDGDADELLELGEDEAEMVEAIETLRRRIERARPRPGRLRWMGFALSLAVVAALLLAWLPGALVTHATAVVPPVKRAEIGAELLLRLERVAGKSCGHSGSYPPLGALRTRLGAPALAVSPMASPATLILPGPLFVLSKTLVEDHDSPDVVAGHMLAGEVLLQRTDPLRPLLEFGGPMASFRLLTTGSLQSETLDAYAEHLLAKTEVRPETGPLLAAFAAAGVPTAPYAYAVDITGETVLDLIESDPLRGRATEPVLDDATWIRLQAICEF